MYCGRELALFRRLTGGEFCSYSHRQKYNEEYTQLALGRLKQVDPETGSGRAEEKEKDRAPERPAPFAAGPPASPATISQPQNLVRTPPPAPKPRPAAIALPAVVLQPAPPVTRPSPARRAPVEAPLREEPAPAPIAGVLTSMPNAVLAEIKPMVTPEIGFSFSTEPRLWPSRALSDEPAAGPKDLELSIAGPCGGICTQEADSPFSLRGGGGELREHARPGPFAGVRLSTAGEIGLSYSTGPVQVVFDPVRPGSPAGLWQEAAREFAVLPAAFDEMARLDFADTGWEQMEEMEETEAPGLGDDASPATPAAAIEQAVDEPPPVEPAGPQPVLVEPAQKPFDTETRRKPDGPVHFEPVRIEPVFLERWGAGLARETPREPSTEREQENQAGAPPAEPEGPPAAPDGVVRWASAEPATRPVPLTLHGLAPARGKAVQVFASALPPGGGVVTPPQSAFPMRSVMVLEFGTQVEADAATQEPPPMSGKGRKPGSRTASLPSAGNQNEAAPDQPQPPQPQKVPQTVEESKAPAETPAPPALEPVPDLLGLPKLSNDISPGLWSRLPAAARAGAAAVALAAVLAAIFLTSKGLGTSRATPSAPASDSEWVEAGPAILSTAGWITDWFSDPNTGAPRHVDVLPNTLTLRDYRMEFEGQIDRQAMGWVFRASSRKNFYVEKIQWVKPGLAPALVLVRFAVTDGKEQPRVQVPLNLKVNPETMYRVRLDAVGDRFITWVQGNKVDEFSDGQLAAGGVGLYYDNGDVAKLKGGINVVPLKARK